MSIEKFSEPLERLLHYSQSSKESYSDGRMLQKKARSDWRPSACCITRTAAKKATLMVTLSQLASKKQN
jgi:hypothetical protein